MNADVAHGYRERKAEAGSMGEEAHRLHALQHLKLKTVVKESHGSPVHSLCFNLEDRRCSNLFATVGKDQATVYDDAHMGDYIDVILSFENKRTAHTKGGELFACTWLGAEGWTEHPHGDAYLAVAGQGGDISVISVVEAGVVRLLKGHTTAVVELAGCPWHPDLLASLAKDGSVRVWDVAQEICLVAYAANASALAVDPRGTQLLTGSKKGTLHSWPFPPSGTAPSSSPEQGQELLMEGMRHTESVDCIRFLRGRRLASKSRDGRICVWDLASCKQICAWKVPACSAKGGWGEVCKFGATSRGDYICCGNSQGDVRVYAAASGKQVALVSPIKISAPVRACALSEDCRHLLAVLGNGYIFRFEYQKPSAAEAEAPDIEEDTDEEM